MNLDRIHQVATKAAFAGGKVLQSYHGQLTRIDKKGEVDLVTQADIESEKAVIQTIQNTFADHGILAEESGETKNADSSPSCRWIIDPLDGTTNFAHNLNAFAVSIAFSLDNEVVVGVVLSPKTGELFSAQKGKGALQNGNPIRVSGVQTLNNSLIVTGFPYNFKEELTRLMARFVSCLNHAQGVRRYGSAALDLCYLACGRFDGYFEENLHPWDTAAGMLIAREAGARITDYSNEEYNIFKKEILATNGLIHEEMLSIL